MNVLQGVILGLIQGATEFLPISSTAHLTFAGKVLGLISGEHPEDWTAMMAVIQLGTLIAVLLYFRQDLVSIVSAVIEESLVSRRPLRDQSPPAQLGWKIAIGTVPVVVLGLALKRIIEGSLTKNLWLLAGSMIAFGVLLWLAERFARKERSIEETTWADAVIIGFSQAMALFPGASRSGTTITGGLLLGLDREAAARFSFLLSIPAVLASGLYELKEALPHLGATGIEVLIISTFIAGVSGYMAIDFLLKYVRTHNTNAFVYYRVIVGALIILALVGNVVQP